MAYAIIVLTIKLVEITIILGGKFQMDNVKKNEVSNKEEILTKNRQSNNDEGIEYAVNKGARLGNYYTEAIGFLLVMFCIISGQILTMYALFTLYGAHCFGDFLAKYRYFKQKRYLIGIIVFGVVFGGYFAFLFVRDVGLIQGWWG